MLCHWQIVTILSVAAPQPAYLPGAAAFWGEHRSFFGVVPITTSLLISYTCTCTLFGVCAHSACGLSGFRA